MKTIKILLIFIFTISLAVLFWYLNSKLPQKNELVQKEKEFVLMRNIELSYTVTRKKINESSLYNCNDSLFITLNERLDHNPQLVFYIPEDQCNDCVIKEFNKLKELPSWIQNNIIIISNFSTLRSAKYWIADRVISYPMYNSVNSLFNEPVGSTQIALFVLDTTLVPQHVFFPISFISETSSQYYTFIEELFNTIRESNNLYSNKTTAVVRKNKHNFGKIKLNKIVTAEFYITNTGDSPLVIDDVDTTCGCMTVRWNKNAIKINETDTIIVDFKADDLGVFKKFIYLKSNINGNPILFSITGNVIKE